MADPMITDNDHGEITATVGGVEVRGWSYRNDDERRLNMRMAHEFAEGWFRSTTALKNKIDTRLNDYLCEMKEGWDDSITGFNEAWDIVRKILEPAAPASAERET